MRVWLLHIGEELPVDGPTRPFRYGYLAQALADRGHEVLRWAPTFRHVTKKHRFSSDRRVSVARNYAIQFVHSPGYHGNATVARLNCYRVLGRRFRQLASRESAPDVIVAAIPSLEWANAAIDIGRRYGAKVVIDIRDLWPDVFLNAIPAAARRTGQLLLAPYRRLARRACRGADALAAVSTSYLQWGLCQAGRELRLGDRIFPLGCDPERVSAAALDESVAELRSRGIDAECPAVLFAGAFERSYDLETVIDTARRVAAGPHRHLQFILCGDGSKTTDLRRRAAGLLNVHFTGWVDAPMLQAAESIASIGLCTYANDALQSVPNKPFEYMANRLAVVSSLRGDMEQVLDLHDCGLTYGAGNAADLADCVAALIGNPQRLDTMRTNAHRAWLHHFRASDVYSQFADHLTLLVYPASKAA